MSTNKLAESMAILSSVPVGKAPEVRKEIPYWPYCEECQQPYDFDSESSHAYCHCGTTEWGYPRPAPYVQKPMMVGKCWIPIGKGHPKPKREHADELSEVWVWNGVYVGSLSFERVGKTKEPIAWMAKNHKLRPEKPKNL